MTAYEIRRILQQLGTKLEFRIASMSRDTELLPAYSPYDEGEYREEVDRLCREIAKRVAVSADAALTGLPSLHFGFQELVLWRVRDAQRRLSETGLVGPKARASVPDAVAHLLVDGWHSYAEPYWLERLARDEEPLHAVG